MTYALIDVGELVDRVLGIEEANVSGNSSSAMNRWKHTHTSDNRTDAVTILLLPTCHST